MKSLRLLAFALLACACTASAAVACDAHKKSAKNTATSAKATSAKSSATPAAHAAHAGCTAEMAAVCTPAMAAACMSNAAVASAMGCETTKGTTAAVASNGRPAKAAKGGDCCAMKGASTAFAAKGAAHDCSACADWSACEQDVQSLGAKAQVVALKNGAMIVYTAESPADVKAVQATVAKRHEKLLSALAAGGAKSLCPECKALRGAIASGKLHREVVNVERGCMTLLTSNDQSVVTRIRAMTGQPVAMR